MKKIFGLRSAALIFALMFTMHNQSFAQPYCAINKPALRASISQTGGGAVTSFGTLRVLFIFIDFPDDSNNPTDPTWPVGVGPNFLSSIVDASATQNSGINANVTTFFRDQSQNQFNMIGSAYYIPAPHPLTWYQTNHLGEESAYAGRDAIDSLDRLIDFSQFDGWIDGSNNHTEGQDGIVDMAFICFRQWYISPGQLWGSSFIAEGWYFASLPGDVMVDNGGLNPLSQDRFCLCVS